MRNELESFLMETKAKTSEDGTALVYFPDSFDEISSAMDRGDVTDVDTNQNNWSKEMFSQDYTSEDSRYTQMLSDEAQEMKVQRGIAKIEMLDKKLALLAKKAKKGFSEDELSMNGDDDSAMLTGRTEINSVGSPPSTARSSASTKSTSTQDAMNGLFMTKVKRGSSRASSAHHISQDFRPTSAKRPYSSSSISSQMSGVPVSKKEKELHRKALLAPDLEETELWEDISRYGYSAAEQATLEEIDRKLNEYKMFDFHTHTSEDLDFLRETPYEDNAGDSALEVANDGTLSGKSTGTGSGAKVKANMKNNIGDGSSGREERKKKSNMSKETDNFLASSRLERVRKQYMATLDQALGKYAHTNGKVLLDEDLSCLLDKTPPTPRMISTPPSSRSSRRSNEVGGSGSKVTSRSHTSPSTSRIGTAKSTRSVRSTSSSASKITYQDVQKAIRETIDGYRQLEGLEPYTEEDYNDYNDNINTNDQNNVVHNNNHEEQDEVMEVKTNKSDETPNISRRKKNKKKLVSTGILASDESLQSILLSIEDDVMRLNNLKKQVNSPGSNFIDQHDHHHHDNDLTVNECDENGDHGEGDDDESGFIDVMNEDSNLAGDEYVDMNGVNRGSDDYTVNMSDTNQSSVLFTRRRNHYERQQQQQRRHQESDGDSSPVYQSQIPTLPAISRRNGSMGRNISHDSNVSVMRGMVRNGNKSLRL